MRKLLKILDFKKEIKTKRKSFVFPVWSGKSVLIAEDDEANYIYLEKALRATQIKISRDTNGLEVIDLFKKETPDIVLMDIKMPVMDGYQATRAIKALNKEIPVIAQTAYAMGDEEEMCYASGCDGYLVKPIKPEVIIYTLEKYL